MQSVRACNTHGAEPLTLEAVAATVHMEDNHILEALVVGVGTRPVVKRGLGMTTR